MAAAKGNLEVCNIVKRYPINHGRNERVILDGISFTLRPGEKLGILGRNGAGKSTLVRIISGSESANSGEIVRGMSLSWPLAFGGAFIGSLTGKDNTRLIARVYGVDYHQMLEYVKDFAELGPYIGEPVKSYSHGMQARLAFAISMAIEFDCYLIDEVMAVGDHRFTEKCNRDLFENRGDRAMIIVSHSVDIIRAHCDRAALLENGRLQHFDTVDGAIDAYQALQ
ncbi:ABC transporter ATP-binding protein [Acidithiobacillus caldus]|jgi:capsular polysaccharide transport system ATP-binding protein|uniref:ABC transporter ATP-binding protein n=1 Tax=Acidithiobacillus caldus TaxID=33059 RepID=UPI00056DF222|nr:ABC transporter ATP-binding protein [Acidithiobacillus caldus]MBU2728623.1 ABC transporter ATP-binding protein [Acidithiobacillus caldus]MBU2734501.1 ABC transporter ATP-binding protein [Acidithiobacillus caldus ATCC 51756]MBU2745420.1 ABC transporter ATP-binding protein [Acidithiobacillus caldus]MBU2781252.1 ABC transporter ATP-binding protein [Acidithiobacillus caldus]